jgi:signal transduction histidine kinase
MTAPKTGRLRQRAHGWSLRRRVGTTFAAVAALLAVMLAAVVISLVSFLRKGNEVIYRWQPAAATSQNLLGDLVNQETGVRGYMLSRRIEFLQPYHEYRTKQIADTATLRGLLRDHPDLLGDLDRFTSATADWQQQTAEPLIAAVRAGSPPATGRIDTGADKARFDRVRAAAGTLMADVNQVTHAATGYRRTAAIVLVVALGITGAVIVATAATFWRGLQFWVLHPVNQLAYETREVAEGDPRRAIAPFGPPEFVDLGADVESMRRRIVDQLARAERAGEELRRSNADLEQFAYVASHDLSEPLRKVSNFCQMLERQYGDQLDDKARQYIGYAVDGAKRMQSLIHDLLTLSRVGRDRDRFTAVDTGAALAHALSNLDAEIARSGAGIGHSDLPTVWGDEPLLVSLFENLVGNAIKYRAEEAPLVVVTAVADRSTATWSFAVKDNGIGIDAQYAERVFAIFQRLHLREQYAGTGIGLAMCRRIVEFHGGRIWLDTSEPSGATFRFTLREGRPSEP